MTAINTVSTMDLTKSPDRVGASMCRFDELTSKVAKLVKWFNDEPKRLGWVVTTSCFIIYTASYSLIYGFSLLFIELQHEFDANTSLTGYVGCLMCAMAYLSSPLTAFLQTKISHRSIAVLGSLLCTIGVFMSSFVPSIYYLFLTLGVTYGLGVNFLFHATLSLQLLYFPTNSERAVNLGSCGFSASWMVTVPALHYFIQSYGWRVAMQLMSGVISCLCLISCIPLSAPPTRKLHQDVGQEDDAKRKRHPEQSAKKVNNNDFTDFEKHSVNSAKSKKSNAFRMKPEMWVYFFATAGTMSGWTFYFVNLVSFLTSEVGLTTGQSAFIVFLCGIGEIFGKLVLIIVAGVLQSIPSIYVAVLGNVLNALFTIGLVMSHSYAPAAAFVILASFGRAIWHIYPITGGVEELRNSSGVSTIFLSGMGAGYIMGSFLVGGLRDITGSYEIPMVLVAGVFALSGLLYACIPLIRFVRSRRQRGLGYYSVNILNNNCQECNARESRKLSNATITAQKCTHKNLPRTLIVEDNRVYIESRLSVV